MESSDNKKWFKAKDYGYGWTPASGPGWLVLLLYIWSNLNIFLIIDSKSVSVGDTLFAFAPVFLAQTLLLYTVCVWKGEKPGWRWGKSNK